MHKYKFVPKNAIKPVKNTVVSDESVVIDFCYYRDHECELEKFTDVGKVKKILKFIKQVGQCQDGSEMMDLLKANNSCDISNGSSYKNKIPDGLKIYEVWHKKGCGERIYFTISGYRFYPVVFLARH